ncbi:MAG: hypothetical protein P8Y45_16630 [Exilibacterium sp.]
MTGSEFNDKERQVKSLWRAQPVPHDPDASLQRVLRRANREILAKDLLGLLAAWLWTLAVGGGAIVYQRLGQRRKTCRQAPKTPGVNRKHNYSR